MGRGTILWTRTPVINLTTVDAWNERVDWFNEHGHRVDGSKTVWLDWLHENSFNFDVKGGVYQLYATWHEGYEAVRYYFNSNKQVISSVTGTFARRTLEDMFKARTGHTLRVAFGCVDNSGDFAGYQYAPIIWTDNSFLHKNLNKIYKADVCSAYAYEATKMLPDAHTAIEVEGRPAPTEEYPFAFYVDTNQLAIYGEFDTRDYARHPLNTTFNNFETWHRNNKQYDNRFHYIPKMQHRTILMKASKFSLAPEYNTLYNGRAEHEENKSIMVSSIGNLSSPSLNINGNTPMRHITSVIYARHMVRMMRLYDRITELKGVIISIATDAIMWTCKYDLPVYETVKALGNFYLEYYNCRARVARQGIYALEKDKQIYLVKHQGYTADEVKECKIRNLQDIDKLEFAPRLRYNNETGRIEKK